MQTEALVISALPFKERDRILTLFSPTQGVLKLFVKGKKKLDLHLNALVSPFTVGDYIYSERKSNLHRFEEGKVLEQYLGLRDRLERFEAAHKILEVLMKTQWPGRSAEALYYLTKLFVQRISTHNDPKTLLPVFYVKVLKYEGLLGAHPQMTKLASMRSFSEIEKQLPSPKLAEHIETFFHETIDML